jgi:hypothetical protein
LLLFVILIRSISDVDAVQCRACGATNTVTTVLH